MQRAMGGKKAASGRQDLYIINPSRDFNIRAKLLGIEFAPTSRKHPCCFLLNRPRSKFCRPSRICSPRWNACDQRAKQVDMNTGRNGWSPLNYNSWPTCTIEIIGFLGVAGPRALLFKKQIMAQKSAPVEWVRSH